MLGLNQEIRLGLNWHKLNCKDWLKLDIRFGLFRENQGLVRGLI